MLGRLVNKFIFTHSHIAFFRISKNKCVKIAQSPAVRRKTPQSGSRYRGNCTNGLELPEYPKARDIHQTAGSHEQSFLPRDAMHPRY